jgi:hypothetical protein
MPSCKAAPLQRYKSKTGRWGKKTFFENEDDDENENDRLANLTHADTPKRRHAHT